MVLSEKDNLEKIKKYWWIFVLLGTLLFLMMFLGSQYFIPLLFSNKFYDSIWIAKWLSVSLIFIFVQTMILNLAVYQGSEKFFQKIQILSSVLKLILYAILIPFYFLRGAVFSIIISELLIFIIVITWFFKKVKGAF